jgi:hypothetical protein
VLKEALGISLPGILARLDSGNAVPAQEI